MRREPLDCQHITINLKLAIARRASSWSGINQEASNKKPIALHRIRTLDAPAHRLIALNNGSDFRLFKDQNPLLRGPLTGLIRHEIPHTY
jgi:hypothetical protein